MRILHTTLNHIRTNKQLFMASVGTITIALSILGLFLFVYVNLNTLLSYWNDQVQLIVYLEDKLAHSQESKLKDMVAGHSQVEDYEFISKEKAWKNFQSMFDENSGLIKGLGFNPLPASINIRFKSSTSRLDHIREFAEKIKNQKGVESLEYGADWIGRFESFMILMRIFLLALGGILCLGAVLIISNTIRLSVFSRKDEIELMLLIGATPRFIKTPFLLEGIFHGLMGATLALMFVKGLHTYLVVHFQGSIHNVTRGMEFHFISQPYVLAIILTSVFVGWLGSYLSVHQFLKEYKK
ncbi:ABC transporter permease [candidate division KSB1 bacterium]|nr:ABC transporter permease [candidate division KSB1 bacterium]